MKTKDPQTYIRENIQPYKIQNLKEHAMQYSFKFRTLSITNLIP